MLKGARQTLRPGKSSSGAINEVKGNRSRHELQRCAQGGDVADGCFFAPRSIWAGFPLPKHGARRVSVVWLQPTYRLLKWSVFFDAVIDPERRRATIQANNLLVLPLPGAHLQQKGILHHTERACRVLRAQTTFGIDENNTEGLQ
jgi:hypothetical protein